MITVEVLTRLFFVAERTFVRVVPEKEKYSSQDTNPKFMFTNPKYIFTILLLQFVTSIQSSHLLVNLGDLGLMVDDDGDNWWWWW